MTIGTLLRDFITVFFVSLVVSAVVSVLWSLLVHGTRAIDWETSFRFAILFGIVFSWIESRRRSDPRGSRS
jgi:hypothetical protein